MLRSLPKLAAYTIIMLALVVASFVPYNFGLSDLRNATEWVPTSQVLLPSTFIAYPALPSLEPVSLVERFSSGAIDIPASTLQIAEALSLLLFLPLLYRRDRPP